MKKTMDLGHEHWLEDELGSSYGGQEQQGPDSDDDDDRRTIIDVDEDGYSDTNEGEGEGYEEHEIYDEEQ